MNPRITKKEKELIKGALRRAFSRSELRKQCIEGSIIKGHTNPDRPRVKTWCRCSICKQPEAKSSMQADHVIPVVPLTSSLADMDLNDLINNIWCDPKNLQPVCKNCHKAKTKIEIKERAKNRRKKKINVK